MQTEKPKKLIELLNSLLLETDKPTIGKIYVNIATETLKTEFTHDTNKPFLGLIYKHLIRLSIKDFIHSEQSQESKNVLKEVIDILDSTLIIVK